jgi:hypothetical protein
MIDGLVSNVFISFKEPLATIVTNQIGEMHEMKVWQLLILATSNIRLK